MSASLKYTHDLDVRLQQYRELKKNSGISIHGYPCTIYAEKCLLDKKDIATKLEKKYERSVFENYLKIHYGSHVESGKNKCYNEVASMTWHLCVMFLDEVSNYSVSKFSIKWQAMSKGGSFCYESCGKYNIPNN